MGDLRTYGTLIGPVKGHSVRDTDIDEQVCMAAVTTIGAFQMLVTVENVNKYFPEPEETQKGHMNHQRQGVRSTKPKSVNFEEVDKSLTFGLREKDACHVKQRPQIHHEHG